MKSQSLWKKYGATLTEAYGYEDVVQCKYCGAALVSRDVLNSYENPYGLGEASVDHVVPQSHGGTDDIENLVPCCRSCNSKKSNRGSLEVEMWSSPLDYENEIVYRLFEKCMGGGGK